MQRDEENLTDEEIKEILSVVDLDGNGRVEYSGRFSNELHYRLH